jgi:hypothetical protein
VKAGLMSNKLPKVVLSTLLAGLAALPLAPPAGAERQNPTTTTTAQPGYVPPPYDGGSDEDPFESPFEDPVVVPLEDVVGGGGVSTDPGADQAGGGETARPAPGDAPAIEPTGLPVSGASPDVESPKRGGILSKTGAETMTLVRAGLAALALGGGFVVLGRRRRAGQVSS